MTDRETVSWLEQFGFDSHSSNNQQPALELQYATQPLQNNNQFTQDEFLTALKTVLFAMDQFRQFDFNQFTTGQLINFVHSQKLFSVVAIAISVRTNKSQREIKRIYQIILKHVSESPIELQLHFLSQQIIQQNEYAKYLEQQLSIEREQTARLRQTSAYFQKLSNFGSKIDNPEAQIQAEKEIQAEKVKQNQLCEQLQLEQDKQQQIQNQLLNVTRYSTEFIFELLNLVQLQNEQVLNLIPNQENLEIIWSTFSDSDIGRK
ncbi:Hypothetical_protein [Hexamita inflata]|uniref:Hypothetical_protein n=1 Tax=Hexamita inflata TaxID=28002 RepID=A0AA86U958_9EUKA|nr:Hypothetical protein HINF_LOCUS35970 [Hexamita inflata]